MNPRPRALALILLAAVTGCSGPEREVRTGSAGDPPNVVLITVDTLRADHVGAYGNDRIRTPAMDALARDGVVFENAYSVTHVTTPSHVSIFSSRFPREHGSYANGKQVLDERLVLLPELLRDRGYRTAAFISLNAMRPDWVAGLERGFDVFSFPDSLEAPASSTLDAVEDWMDRGEGGPFFLWVHLFDPHMPYAPPPPYDSMYYEGDPYTGEDTMAAATFPRGWYANNFFKTRFIDWLDPIRDVDYPRAQYMAEVSFVDGQVGRLQELLREHGHEPETWIFLTADHGESLGEHQVYFDHQGLYESTLAVPLIVWHAREVVPGRVEQLASTLDIFPTVLDLLGAPEFAASGASLARWLRGDRTVEPRYLFAEGARRAAVSVFDGEWRYTRSLKDLDYSEGYRRRSGQAELFRNTDWGTDVLSEHPAVAERLGRLTDVWLRMDFTAPGTTEEPMTEEDRDLLRSLGYLALADQVPAAGHRTRTVISFTGSRILNRTFFQRGGPNFPRASFEKP